MEFHTGKYVLLLFFTVPIVFCDGIFYRKRPLSPTKEGGVLEPEEDTVMYNRDHSVTSVSI
jgi:hypothetical protein